MGLAAVTSIPRRPARSYIAPTWVTRTVALRELASCSTRVPSRARAVRHNVGGNANGGVNRVGRGGKGLVWRVRGFGGWTRRSCEADAVPNPVSLVREARREIPHLDPTSRPRCHLGSCLAENTKPRVVLLPCHVQADWPTVTELVNAICCLSPIGTVLYFHLMRDGDGHEIPYNFGEPSSVSFAQRLWLRNPLAEPSKRLTSKRVQSQSSKRKAARSAAAERRKSTRWRTA